MRLINKYRQFTRIYTLGPAKLASRFWHLLFGNGLFLRWKIGYLLKSRQPQSALVGETNRKAVLVVLHQNPFKNVGGVERETIALLKRLSQKYPKHLLLVYFYDNASQALILTVVGGRKIEKVVRLSGQNPLTEVLNTCNVKVAVFEHLINHPLSTLKEVVDRDIPSLLFIHDFYFLFKIPHPRNLDRPVPADLNDWWQEIKNMASNQPLHVVFNSEFTQDVYNRALDLSGLPVEKILSLTPLNMNIAFVGNFTEIKGSQIFKDLVKHYGVRHNWHIFGIVHDKDSFFQIKENIKTVYPYEEGELPKLLAKDKIDIVLLLSTWPETFSKTFFEAVQSQTPVISFGLGFPGFQFPHYSVFTPFEEGLNGLIKKIDGLPESSLKDEISVIKEQFSSNLKASSERKFELIERLLGE